MTIDSTPPDIRPLETADSIQSILEADEDRTLEIERNRFAGRQAKASSAIEAASQHYRNAIDAIAEGDWSSRFDYCFSLFEDGAECQYISGNTLLSEKLYDHLLFRARNRLERLRVCRALITQHVNKGMYADAITLGLRCLREFHIRIPRLPSAGAVSKARTAVKKIAADHLPQLAALPQARNTDAQEAIELVLSLLFPALAADRNVFTVLFAKFVQLSLKYGHTPGFPAAYAFYGLHLCYDLERYEAGLRLVKAAYEISESAPIPTIHSTITYVLGKATFHWGGDAETGEALFSRAIEQGMSAGNYAFAGLAMIEHVHAAYTRGTLEHVYVLVQRYLPLVIKTDLSLRLLAFCDYLQLILIYTGSIADNAYDMVRLNGSYADAGAEDKAVDKFHLFRICTFRTQQYYLQENYSEAVRAAEAAIPFISSARIVPLYQEHLFYYALAICAAWDTYPGGEKFAVKHKLKHIQEQMKKWATVNPGYYKHKHELISAEIERLSGRESTAIGLYQRSIVSAREGGYIQDAAVANELFAHFFLSKGIEKAARLYMNDAYEGFKEWGAVIKARSILDRYPELLPKEEQKSDAEGRDRRSATRGSTNESDLSSVLKAAQSFLEEADPELLLRKLMRILFDNTGAERGCILLEKEGQLYMELVIAANADDSLSRVSIPLEQYPHLSGSIVRHAASSLAPVKVDDARLDERFREDPYIRDHRPISILCLPISRPEHPNVLLYLENNSVSRAFEQYRDEVLRLLACQAHYVATMLRPMERTFPLNRSSDGQTRPLLLDPLTSREMEVLHLMAGGLSNREISEQIDVVVGTVKNHIKNIFSKLGVSSRMKAVSRAKEQRLLAD
ncbi:helix-turn-helix transcriptional regulator [Paenibacillus hemerocallicola]|uniref:helix-turn-helix transcriptional regulator n=1 Tax=Paenibacillus hemerocallicola TaxID=1172614 RepID=UPI00159EBC09|nr:LuxR C-terminal-related transcriptional regulator [Paenibacillus hemerocallicola]